MSLKTYLAYLNQSGSGNIIPITSSGDIVVTYYRTDTGSYYFVTDVPSATVQLNTVTLSGSITSPLSTDIKITQISGSTTGSIYNILTYNVTIPDADGYNGRSSLVDNKLDYINTGVSYVLQINELESYV